jgi:hypothetical protein
MSAFKWKIILTALVHPEPFPGKEPVAMGIHHERCILRSHTSSPAGHIKSPQNISCSVVIDDRVLTFSRSFQADIFEVICSYFSESSNRDLIRRELRCDFDLDVARCYGNAPKKIVITALSGLRDRLEKNQILTDG